jgi:hypothetical protein
VLTIAMTSTKGGVWKMTLKHPLLAHFYRRTSLEHLPPTRTLPVHTAAHVDVLESRNAVFDWAPACMTMLGLLGKERS